MEKSSRIFIAGHSGLIGSAFHRRLTSDKYTNVITATRSILDLADAEAVELFFKNHRPEYVILAAGKVGGISENQAHPVAFITENLAIQLSVMRAANIIGVRKLIFFGSSCMYPRECPQPMTEASLLTGPLEPTSVAYAVSKLAGVQACLAYNRESGKKRFIPLIPNSAYGPNDNFDAGSGHVLSALIKRFHEAKVKNLREIFLWGTGAPRREFIHADDITDACMLVMNENLSENLDFPLNLGSGADVSIKELAELIRSVVGYDGDLIWDTSKPDGSPQKLLDSSRIASFGWRPKIDLEDGIRQTYEWFKKTLS